MAMSAENTINKQVYKRVRLPIGFGIVEVVLYLEQDTYIILVSTGVDGMWKTYTIAESKEKSVINYKYALLNKFIQENKTFNPQVASGEQKLSEFSISFDTQNISSQQQDTFYVQIVQDTLIALNGMSWKYHTDAGLHNRFNFICGYSSNISKDTAPKIKLNSPIYGKYETVQRLPGTVSTCNDFTYLLYRLQIGEKEIKIPLYYFYSASESETLKKIMQDSYLILRASSNE